MNSATNATPLAAPTAALSLAEKEKRYNAYITRGQASLRGRDNRTWRVGDLAVEVATLWNREDSVIAYARDIQMPRPRTIYDWYHTSKEFPQSARADIWAECPRLRTQWSLFRAAAREANARRNAGQIIEDATVMQWMLEADTNELDADEFAAYLRDGQPAYITKRATYEASNLRVQDDGRVILCIPADKVADLVLKRGNREFAVRLAISWQEETVK